MLHLREEARQQLSNLLNGIPLSTGYDWKNDGEDAAENEHNFGTVTYQFEPKPAYRAAQTVTRELSGYRIARRIDVGSTDDFVLVLTNSAAGLKLAAWTTTTNTHTVAFSANISGITEAKAVTAAGEATEVLSAGGQLRIELTPAPKYIAWLRPRVNRP